MDSTLVQQDVMVEMAKVAGAEKQTSDLMQAASRGDVEFYESLKQWVTLLKGYDADTLFKKVNDRLTLTPGALKLCQTLKKLGYRTAVISGSFLPVAQEVQRRLDLNYAFANVMEVDENTGQFTGLTSGPIVTPERKRALLATMANVEGCEVQQTVAVGDSVNDIPMLDMAGQGIAFSAKSCTATEDTELHNTDLSLVLYLIGVSAQAVERLSVTSPPRKRTNSTPRDAAGEH